MKYKFIADNDVEYDYHLDGIVFEVLELEGQVYMEGGAWSIPVERVNDELFISRSKNFKRVGKFVRT